MLIMGDASQGHKLVKTNYLRKLEHHLSQFKRKHEGFPLSDAPFGHLNSIGRMSHFLIIKKKKKTCQKKKKIAEKELIFFFLIIGHFGD